MAHIKRIQFDHVNNKNEGCLCDNCGQWITNIWTVSFQEGESLHFGIDCFDKHINGKLSAYGKKEMKKILKKIQKHSKLLDELKQDEITEDVQKEWESFRYWQKYWEDKTIDEWKKWMIEETVPHWLEADDKELARFKKINF